MTFALNIDTSQLFEQHENILMDMSGDALINDDVPEIQSISESDGLASNESEVDHAGPSFHRPTYKKGTSWDYQKHLTELQALDTLDEIQGLLWPLRPGKQKHYKDSKVEAWGRKVLGEFEVFFNLFMGANSKVKG